MPPHEDEPMWPSDDTDETGLTPEGDGGATAHLPVPSPQTDADSGSDSDGGEGTDPAAGSAEKAEARPGAEAGDGGQEARHQSGSDRRQEEQNRPPKVTTLADQPTLWVRTTQPATGQRPNQPPRPGPARQQAPSPQELTQQLPVVAPWAKQPSPGRPGRPPVTDQTSSGPGQSPVPPAGLVHAQPMRIEPSTGETSVVAAEAEREAKPRRRKRGFVYSGLAVVVVIAVAVALALPYVSNRLGLPWAPNLPKGDSPQPATVNLSLQAPSSSAPTPTTGGIGSALAGPSANATLGTLTGIVIDPATGDVLWNHDSGQLLTPASTTKLLTTSAALLQLDHGLQLTTKVVQGSAPDTAVIVAGGDLTLSSLPDGKESVYQGAAHLDDLVSQVKKAGGGTVKKVQIDLSAYTGATTAPGWAPDDAPSLYATQIVPGMLDGGMSDPANDHSMRSGNPAADLLQAFAQRLGVSVAPTSTAKAPQGAKVLGEVRSAPLTELIAHLLEHSDNELAEAVARQTAIATGQPSSFAGGAQATLNVLSQNGFDISGVSLNDGSGLSTLNKVPAKLLAQLLSVAAAPEGKDPRTAKLRPLLEGLPVAGGSGTLADRYGDPNSSAGKGWIRAKTGTLSGVNTLAGDVLDKDGRVLVFALMSNNNGDINATRAALDAVAAKLRGCGCQ